MLTEPLMTMPTHDAGAELRNPAATGTAAPAAAASGDSGLQVFFVRGHARSGTNWVGRLLNLHPRIRCTGEWHLNALVHAAENITSQGFMMSSRPPYRKMIRDGVRSIVRACLTTTCADDPHVSHAGDRSPAPLEEMAEGGRYFLVVRDGRDVLVSFTYLQLSGRGRQFRQGPFAEIMRPAMERFAADPFFYVHHPEELLSEERWVRWAARQWSERVLADMHTAEGWNADSPRVHEVRYESLHEDVESRRRAMYRFLGLDPDEARPIESGEDTLPGLGTENPASYRRKGEIGEWKRYFTPQVAAWFKAEAGEALHRLGYASQDDW